MKEGVKVPNVTFRVRVPDENGEFDWADMPSDSIFKGKKVAVFSLPGAFTPTCSSFQLPGYEEKYDELKKHVDEVYCLSVNDSFVMNAWAKDLAVENVKMIPDTFYMMNDTELTQYFIESWSLVYNIPGR